LPRLHFKGKVFVENHHFAVPFHELLPVRDKGLSEKKASLRDNLIVHGDNLAALKSLLPTYHGKVKCVYIDPPYNTGNEGWPYNDNVNSPLMRDWLGRSGGPRRPDPARQVVLHDDAAPQAPSRTAPGGVEPAPGARQPEAGHTPSSRGCAASWASTGPRPPTSSPSAASATACPHPPTCSSACGAMPHSTP